MLELDQPEWSDFDDIHIRSLQRNLSDLALAQCMPLSALLSRLFR